MSFIWGSTETTTNNTNDNTTSGFKWGSSNTNNNNFNNDDYASHESVLKFQCTSTGLFNKDIKSTDMTIPNWLTTTYLLRSLNDKTIEECYYKILKLFEKNKKDFIFLLLNTALHSEQNEKFTAMIEILKNAQLEIENKTNCNIFDKLPVESVNNICVFLDRTDMGSFKMVSTSIALIIFDIMKCVKIGSFNMHELIEINEYKYQKNIDIKNKIKINRFQPFTKHKSLIDIYCNKYHIQFENMLMLQVDKFVQGDRIEGGILQKNIDAKIQNDVAFVLFDKTKIHSISNMDSEISKSSENFHVPIKRKLFTMNSETLKSNENLVLLQYFDRYSQTIQNIQFLSIKHENESQLKAIEEYIENDLQFSDDKFYETVSKMKQFRSQSDIKEKLINIYNITYGISGSNNISVEDFPINYFNKKAFRLLLFELNDKHSFFQTNNSHFKTKSLTQPIYSNIMKFVEDQNAAFGVTLVNPGGTTDNITLPWNISLKATPLTTYKMIQHKISSILDDKIPPNNIEIYKLSKPKQILSGDEYITNQHSLNWCVVPYCTITEVSWNLHKVFIYQKEVTSDVHSVWNDKRSTSWFWFINSTNASCNIDMRYKQNEEILIECMETVESPTTIDIDAASQTFEWVSNSPNLNDNSTGTKTLQFKPHHDYTAGKNGRAGKTFYYQHLGVGNKTFESKSSGELRFEDQFGQVASTGNDAQTDINNDNNNNKNTWSWGNNNNNTQFTFSNTPIVSNNKNNTNNNSSTAWSWGGNNSSTNNNNNGGWSFGNYTSKTVVKVNDFIEHMINTMSHKMFGDKYKTIIDKYNDKENYSFVMMSTMDINNQKFKWYECDDKCTISMQGIYFDTHVLIIKHDKELINNDECKLDKNECFPITLRLCKQRLDFGCGRLESGYPLKVWINTKTKVRDLLSKYNISKDTKFDSCWSKQRKLELDDVIYNKNDNDSKELLITFRVKCDW